MIVYVDSSDIIKQSFGRFSRVTVTNMSELLLWCEWVESLLDISNNSSLSSALREYRAAKVTFFVEMQSPLPSPIYERDVIHHRPGLLNVMV